ncbi:hypothetical protein [Streptomyces sp. NPDC091268]|uniref:hypothetical protein n=1 Tax=Streptomyces sp. NPDC091268 TaxID=3365979 RepID=UPI003824928B
MHARIATVIAAAAALALTAPQAAHAGIDDGSTNGGASNDGKTIHAETKIQVSTPGDSGSAKTGTLTSENTNWDPPACWYEPAFSPKEIESTVKAVDSVPFVGDLFATVLNGYYKDGSPYKDYNLDKQGKGMFWASVINPKRKDDPAATSCDKLPFWVDNGTTPSEPLAVSPQVLAEYAYDEIKIPDTDISMAPAGKSTVNLPSWIWLDKATFSPRSVTASIPNSGLSATTTATPVSLRIQPGTADAQLHPASGECPIGADGRIGTPFSADKQNQTPDCGVTYLRSTAGTGPHKLKATITWKITWTGSNGQGGTLPNGTFATTQDVTVQEIQAINR